MELTGLLKAAAWLVITFIYAYLFGGVIPYFIFYTSMLFLLIAFISSRISNRVSSQCYTETVTAQVGSRVRLTIEVKNNSGWPVPWVQLWVETPETFGLPDNLACYAFFLMPHEKKVFSEEMVCQVRGRFEWGHILVKTGDIFGMFSNSLQMGEEKEIMIMPEVVDLGDDLMNVLGRRYGEIPASSHSGRGGTNFLGIRQYDSGDGISRIHWKATARSQKLLVKEYQNQSALEFTVFLDMDENHHAGTGPRGSIEKAVTLASSLIAYGTKGGYGTGIVIYGKERKAVPVGYGKSHFNLILHSLMEARSGHENSKGTTLYNDIALLTKNRHSMIITGHLDEQLIESLMWLRSRGQGSTVFLFQLETFDAENVDIKGRRAKIMSLENSGIKVISLGKETDLRLAFRRNRYGVC